MIRISTVVWVISIGAAALFIKPNVDTALETWSGLKEIRAESQNLKDNMAEGNSSLAEYKEKYDNLDLSTNYDIAKTVNGLKGAKLNTIKSLAIKDGELFECAEVSSIEDVNFFSEETKKMSFQLKLTDAAKFVNSLKESALVTDSMIIDNGDKTVTIVVNSVFSTPTDLSLDEDLKNENSDAGKSDSDNGPASNKFEEGGEDSE